MKITGYPQGVKRGVGSSKSDLRMSFKLQIREHGAQKNRNIINK
jgi:hypothetical protein